eukprot:Clim_evm6s67 gene=Clim_evmTU6s67
MNTVTKYLDSVFKTIGLKGSGLANEQASQLYGAFVQAYVAEQTQEIKNGKRDDVDKSLSEEKIAKALKKDKCIRTVEKALSKVPARETVPAISVGGRGDVVSKEAVHALASGLKKVKFVKAFKLENAEVDARCMEKLTDAILDKSTLETLDLRGAVGLDEIAIVKLLAGLQENTYLRRLAIRQLHLNADIVVAMSRMLRNTRFLREVDIKETPIGDDLATQFVDILQKTPTLASVEMDREQLSPEVSQKLDAVILRNKEITAAMEEMLGSVEKRNFANRMKTFQKSIKRMAPQADGADGEGTGSDTPAYKMFGTARKQALEKARASTPLSNFESGEASKMGRRDEMQDVTFVQPAFSDGKDGHIPMDFIGVFDGHGSREPATYAAGHLPELIYEQLECMKPEVKDCNADRVKAIKHAFSICHDRMAPWCKSLGTTATCCVILNKDLDQVYLANIGDSRGLLLSKSGKALQQLTVDHLPTNDEEVRRIENGGGKIIENRVEGRLAITRALGDSELNPHVSPEPYVTRVDLSKFASDSEDERPEWIIMASDGLWDVLSNETVGQVVAQAASCGEAADRLCHESFMAKSNDNIAVVALRLHPKA